MIILTLRTDKPESEIGLYEDEKQIAYEVWQAHRALAETLHQKIENLLKTQDKKLSDLGGIIAFKGPGSFTGLRIGLSVANSLAYSLQIPVVAREADWIEVGIKALLDGKNERVVIPEYGAEAFVTQPKK